MTPDKSKSIVLFAVLAVAYCCPMLAQGPIPLRIPPPVVEGEDEQEPVEEPAEPTADTEAPSPSPFVAAGWCTVKESGEDSATAPTDPIDGDEDTQSTNDSASDSYCDIGIGFALYTKGRVSIVGVIGSMSTGLGLAVRVPTPERGPILAVAIGILVRYDADGIGRDVHPGLGITLTFGREGGD